MKLISYYPKGIMLKKGKDNPPEQYLSFEEFLQLHTSKEMKELKEKVNKYPYGSYMYKRTKMMLPCVLFNKFAYNLNEGFLEENDIKPFDVDLSENTPEEIKRFKEDIKKEAICVIDSIGGGVKFFIKKRFNTSDSYEYKDRYNEVCDEYSQKYNIVLDKAQGRIKQPFFISYQKEISCKTELEN